MSKAAKKNTTAELEGLRLPELQARFRDVVGEISKSPNRKFLIRRIEEALAAQAKKAPETPVLADGPEVAPPASSVTVAAEPAVEVPANAMPSIETQAPALTVLTQESLASASRAREVAPAADLAAAEPTTAAPSKPARGRFSALSVAELQAKYLEVVGRATGSDNKAYLIWKIREAEKGRITVGPVQPRKSEGDSASDDVKILPLRLETKVVEAMDAAWRERGIKNRMEFFRRALSHYLVRLGATEAAAMFDVTSSTTTPEGAAQ